MRIIAGKYAGCLLNSPCDRKIRPTTDRIRENLFNILEHQEENFFLGRQVLDLFSGTGALGFEALSRGAQAVLFIEKNADALKILQENRKKLAAIKNTAIVKGDATKIQTFKNVRESAALLCASDSFRGHPSSCIREEDLHKVAYYHGKAQLALSDGGADALTPAQKRLRHATAAHVIASHTAGSFFTQTHAAESYGDNHGDKSAAKQSFEGAQPPREEEKGLSISSTSLSTVKEILLASKEISSEIGEGREGVFSCFVGFDLVFADPPYGFGMGEQAFCALAASGLLAKNACLILEEEKTAHTHLPENFSLYREKIYGRTRLQFYRFLK